jgi:serpin B
MAMHRAAPRIIPHRQMNCTNCSVIFVLIAIGLAGCSDEPVPKGLTTDEFALVKGNNEFATDLYKRLSADASGNLFFSPYGISSALAMSYAGANGETAAQMATVLHFPAPAEKLHSVFGTLREKISSGERAGYQLRIANRLWGQDGFHFLPEFLQVTRDDYAAELGLVDFRQAEAARETINAWTAQQTEGKIQDLLAPGLPDPNMRLVLTNAIYFKAPWARPFDKRRTSSRPFHVSATEQVGVPMMHQTDGFWYGESDNVQILELPYGPNGELAMIILLPKQIDGLANLEKRLSRAFLKELLTAGEGREVDVELPKFRIDSEFRLVEVLESLGMPGAFSRHADFSRMSKQEGLFLSAVIHKTLVDVNEEGTEAAAATAARGPALSDEPPPKPVEFRADHPFVFLIWDVRTKSILFLGRVVNPQELNPATN